MIDFQVRVVEPAGYVCVHGNGPEASKDAALRFCDECIAALKELRLVAPSTRTGCVWRPTGLYLIGHGFRLVPLPPLRRKGASWEPPSPRDRPIYRTLSELEKWTTI